MENQVMKYPKQYLHVLECASGREWIVPLKRTDPLDLKQNIETWVAREFGEELRLSGKLMRGIDGAYYGQILTDGRPPHSAVVWQSGGFYLEAPQMRPDRF